jgi:calcineurin-like phosphoesterase family protein
MPTTFFIGDTHFSHKGIIQFDETKPFRQFDSIEEHDEELIRRWNSVVTRKDNIWHLGDFCFGAKNIAIAGRLNGYKRLVMGNHDVYDINEYLKYFSKVFGAAQYKEMILTHIPVHEGQFGRYKFNVHGHLHTKVLDDPRYVNVSCERINLTPISFDEIYR